MAISADLSSSLSAAAASVTNTDDGNVAAFLAEFVSYCDTHWLVPLDFPISDFVSIPEILVAAVNGFLDPEVDIDDNPLWSEAMASPKREYWIAGAQDEVRSLEKLKVFVLASVTMLVKWCVTRSATLLRASRNGMALIIIRQQRPPLSLNPFKRSPILPHHWTGTSVSSTSKWPSSMAFFPLMRQCLWNSLLVSHTLVRRIGFGGS